MNYKWYLGAVMAMIFGICAVGNAANHASLEKKVEAKVNKASQQKYEIKSSFTHAFDVAITVINKEGDKRHENRPGVLIGAKHMMVFLGRLQKGETITNIVVEKQLQVRTFQAAFNNIWVSEQKLYKELDDNPRENAFFANVVLALELPRAVSNQAVPVLGMDANSKKAELFKHNVHQAAARRSNIVNIWDKMYLVDLQTVHTNQSGVTQFHTSSAHFLGNRVGEPLFIKFKTNNSFGQGDFVWFLVGFRMEGDTNYWGFSGYHMLTGNDFAPEVQFIKI